MSYNTITRRIKLQPIYKDSSKESKQEFWDALRKIQKSSFKAVNYGLNYLYGKEEQIPSILKSRIPPKEYNILSKTDIKRKEKEIRKELEELLGYKEASGLYRLLQTNFPDLPSNITPSLVNISRDLFNKYWTDLKLGKSTLPTVKNTLPMPTIKTYLKIREDHTFTWYKKLGFKLFFGRDRSNNRHIVNEILKGNYKLCDSSVQIKDDDIFLLLVVQIPKQEVYLNEEVAVGVDLGIVSTAVLAVNKGFSRMTIPNSILKPKLSIQKQRKDLQKSLKYVKGGKGRGKKLQKLNKLSNAESNTTKLINHSISKEVVNFALKHHAHKIYLEDLKGIDTNNFILRNWTYFDLQTKVEQKAKRYGILVEKIKPTYTSQVCNCCGAKGKREKQAEFICFNEKCELYLKKINADYNAAKNIANGGLGLSYNKETKEFFESLEYGQVVLPESEGKNHSESSLYIGTQLVAESTV